MSGGVPHDGEQNADPRPFLSDACRRVLYSGSRDDVGLPGAAQPRLGGLRDARPAHHDPARSRRRGAAGAALSPDGPHGLPRPPAGAAPLGPHGDERRAGHEPALLPQPAGLLPGRGGDPSVHSPKHCRALLHFDLEGPAHQAQALRPGPGLSGLQLCGGPLKRLPLPLRPRSAPRPGLGADLRFLHALWPKSPHLARGAVTPCSLRAWGPWSCVRPKSWPCSSRPPGPSRRPSA